MVQCYYNIVVLIAIGTANTTESSLWILSAKDMTSWSMQKRLK